MIEALAHRPRGIIPKHTAQAADALRERFVGDRNTAPDIVHELVFRHKRAGIGCKQNKRIKIAAGDVDNDAIAMQASAAHLKREAAEPETI
ncbi:MAG: hypothetical protein LW623_06520 [Sphingomonadaceae bacterium]|nr:hypothetical protein [Sphingomonadaceae bacterium]